MQFQFRDYPYQPQNEKELMTKTHMTNSGEDHFNESLITLLNGQYELQKQSLNMMQDITCRHDYDNLMRDIPIYDGKKIQIWQVGSYRLKK